MHISAESLHRWASFLRLSRKCAFQFIEEMRLFGGAQFFQVIGTLNTVLSHRASIESAVKLTVFTKPIVVVR